MLILRKMETVDKAQVSLILNELDIGHPSLKEDDFYMAVDGKMVVGVVNLKDCGKSFYLSSVGVKRSMQGRGCAREMIGKLISTVTKDIYLYTRIPSFFERFGFIRVEPSIEIPPRDIYGCDACEGLVPCECMVRRDNAE